jgi:hypothetical protein
MTIVSAARLFLSTAIMLMAVSAIGRADTKFSWKYGPQEDGAYASYEDGGEGEDRVALISIYCRKGDPQADLVFWEVAQEGDDGKKTQVTVSIEDVTRFVSGTASSKMNGVGVDVKIDLADPLLEKMASGKSMDFGIQGRKFTTVPLKGTRKAINLIKETCR